MNATQACSILRTFAPLSSLKRPSETHLEERAQLVAIVEAEMRDDSYVHARNLNIPTAEIWADSSKEPRGSAAWTRAFLLHMDQLTQRRA